MERLNIPEKGAREREGEGEIEGERGHKNGKRRRERERKREVVQYGSRSSRFPSKGSSKDQLLERWCSWCFDDQTRLYYRDQRSEIQACRGSDTTTDRRNFRIGSCYDVKQVNDYQQSTASLISLLFPVSVQQDKLVLLVLE